MYTSYNHDKLCLAADQLVVVAVVVVVVVVVCVCVCVFKSVYG